MIVRTRMILKCPGCHQAKLIEVTIIDDVAGPAMCDACIGQVRIEQRRASHVTLAERLALSSR